MYTLTAIEHGYKTITTEHGGRREAIRYAFNVYGLTAESWMRLGMDVNEITVRGVTYRITDPDGEHRRYPRVR